MGSDIHYSGTLPDCKISNADITTNKYGEVNGLKGFFICDPSRLSFLSTQPHTLTSMAIVNASMPFIIRKLLIRKTKYKI